MRILILAAMVFGCSETWVDVTSCEAGRSECVDPTHLVRCVGDEWIESDCAAECARGPLPVGRCIEAEGLGQTSCGCEP